MKKKLLAIAGLALMMGAGLHAATTQTLLVNGEQVDKVVTRMHFEGDNVVLHFGDETAGFDMATVMLLFDHTASGIESIEMFSFNGAVTGGTLQLQGAEGDAAVEVYSLNGTAVAATVADEAGAATVDVSSLAPGVYILRAGTKSVKFVKR